MARGRVRTLPRGGRGKRADVSADLSRIKHFASTIQDSASGALRFLKGGAGKLTFSGDNTYTDVTAINGGILEITGSIASATTLNRGSIAGDGTLTGDLTINAGATLLPLQPTPFVTGSITLNGALEIADIETLPPAIYTLFTCGGGVANNDAAIANMPDNSRCNYRLSVVNNATTVVLRVTAHGTQVIVR